MPAAPLSIESRTESLGKVISAVKRTYKAFGEGSDMATKTVEVSDAAGAFRVLSELALPNDTIIFRGHSCEAWRLESTLVRHVRDKRTEMSIRFMEETLDYFYHCLDSIGKLPERSINTPRTQLEFARHYGVPSPLIDFTRSPYMALWIAFNGVRPWDVGNVVVYALDVNNLGILWLKHTGQGGDAFEALRWERGEEFEAGYPVGVLKYLELPSRWNTRMLRQLGVFIYDSLQYGRNAQFRDLEEFIEKGIDPLQNGEPTFTLRKVLIPKKTVSDVFTHLELMGIDGTRLFDNHEGAVADVKNGYVFNRRTGYSRPYRSP